MIYLSLILGALLLLAPEYIWIVGGLIALAVAGFVFLCRLWMEIGL